MILTVEKDRVSVNKVQPTTFTEHAIWERKHIQEWIRQHPNMLGEDLLILSIEFDRFNGSADRLDLLALDRKGNLVVVELKRDAYAGYADLQAIRYAAMVSSMTMETLIPYYVAYQHKFEGKTITKDEAITFFQEFVEFDEFVELSKKPRIILCAQDFSVEITTTVLWLRENFLDISCVRITPYSDSGRTIIVPSRIIPIPKAEQYQIDIRRKEQVEGGDQRKYRPRSMPLLLKNGALKAGDKILLKNALPGFMRFEPNDPTYSATITGKTGQSNAVTWDFDLAEYSISGLTWKIFGEKHPNGEYPGAVNGNWHWTDAKGEALSTIAERLYREGVEGSTASTATE